MFLKPYRNDGQSAATRINPLKEKNWRRFWRLEGWRRQLRTCEPWHFIAVTDAEKRKALSGGTWAKFLSQAPLVIVACGDKKASPDWYAIDVALAVENMVLTAVNLGLGTCCVGSFNEKDVTAALKVPENFEVLVMLAVGYPGDHIDLSSKLLNIVRKRKSLSEVASEEEYGKHLIPKKIQEL